MINRISPFIIEILLGITIGTLLGLYFNFTVLYEWLKINDGLVLKIYLALITVSVSFTIVIFNENDKDFIKFLIKNNAERWYRLASIFNLGSFILGLLTTLLLPTFEQNNILLWVTLSIIGINIIQVYTMLELIHNYIDVKRKFQNYH